ncbi:hypothetical protein [Cupriavidus sp. H39]|uniref:hypothetical protein n=1 Tax=Cupriavidus sp. H39 TaxID=3401635 RepID=UPI003D003B03
MEIARKIYWKFIIAKTKVGLPASFISMSVAALYVVWQIAYIMNLNGTLEECTKWFLVVMAVCVVASFITYREGLMLTVGWWPNVLEVHAGRKFFTGRKKPEALAALCTVIHDARESGVQTITLETPLFSSKPALDRLARRIYARTNGNVISYRTSLEYFPWLSTIVFSFFRIPFVCQFSKIEERRGRLAWHGWQLLCGRMEFRLRPRTEKPGRSTQSRPA